MNNKNRIFILFSILILLTSCSPSSTPTAASGATQPVAVATPSAIVIPSAAAAMNTELSSMNSSQFADVLSISVSGEAGAYQFAVEVASPDTGCEQYADWWEVFSEDGKLLYRRILLHSHVDEQPFVRSGGPVSITADEVVYVRAHMNTVGYGGLVMRGTVQDGFKPAEAKADFGSGLERVPPQPEDCAF